MIVTCYSFKGGVGRSMALANIAELLAQRGYSVIVCDWDLEAPGLERYFEEDPARLAELRAKPGVIDLIAEYKDTLTHPMAAASREAELRPAAGFERVGDINLRQPHTWAEPLARDTKMTKGTIRFLPAGRRDGEWEARYDKAVTGMDWAEFYEKWDGGTYFEFFREDLNKHADIVLIDSRTGVTELGGICTHHLADLVLVFTAANDQNLEGAKRMIASLTRPEVRAYREERALGILPIASRVDTRSEEGEVMKFKRRFNEAFGDLLREHSGPQFLELSLIPYVGLYSYIERPVARVAESERNFDLLKPYLAITEAVIAWGTPRSLLPRISSAPGEAARIALDVLDQVRRYTSSGAPSGEFYLAWAPGDEERASSLASALRTAGVAVWCDSTTQSGRRADAIARSAGYLLLMPESADRHWLDAEANAMLGLWAGRTDFRLLLITSRSHMPPDLLAARIPALTHGSEVPMADLAGSVARSLASARSVIHEPADGPALDSLHSPDEMHARFFLGREEALRQLLDAADKAFADGNAPLVVLGGWGSGKSGLMRAGLVNAMQRGLLGAQKRPWKVAYLWLKTDPASELVGTLAALAQPTSGRDAPADIETLVRWLEPNREPIALVIDNADRLTRSGWEKRGSDFFENLAKIRAAGGANLHLVLSERESEWPLLKATWPEGCGPARTWQMPPFDAKGIREFLHGGAKLFGVAWESDVLDRAASDAFVFGATPRIAGKLLNAALSQRDQSTISFRTYFRIGGVEQIIAQDAAKTLAALTGEALAAARRVILRLIPLPERQNRKLTAFEEVFAIAGGAPEHSVAALKLLERGVLTLVESKEVELRTRAIMDVEPVRKWIEAERRTLSITARLEQAVEDWEAGGRKITATAGSGGLRAYRQVMPRLPKENRFLHASRNAMWVWRVAPAAAAFLIAAPALFLPRSQRDTGPDTHLAQRVNELEKAFAQSEDQLRKASAEADRWIAESKSASQKADDATMAKEIAEKKIGELETRLAALSPKSEPVQTGLENWFTLLTAYDAPNPKQQEMAWMDLAKFAKTARDLGINSDIRLYRSKTKPVIYVTLGGPQTTEKDAHELAARVLNGGLWRAVVKNTDQKPSAELIPDWEQVKAPETKLAPTLPTGGGKPQPMYVPVEAIDARARTFTSKSKDGKETKFVITEKTEIQNGTEPAKFDDIKVGDSVSGVRLKKSDTEYEVVKITKFGVSPRKEKK